MELVRELMQLNLSIASYGRCLHNAEIPPDIISRYRPNETEGMEDAEGETDQQDQESRSWALIKSELLKRHKFVLSFENEDVTDYVTEKYYQPFAQGTLSIYFGAPNVDPDFELFPHSFIHLRHFRFVLSHFLLFFLFFYRSYDDVIWYMAISDNKQKNETSHLSFFLSFSTIKKMGTL